MELGVILPHTKLYGGVKRFLELGNIFVEMGHGFTVFTPEGLKPKWFDFKGKMAILDKLNTNPMDAVFLTEIKYIETLANSKAKRKIFYHVRENEPMKKVIKFPDIEIFACSSNIFDHDKKLFNIQPFKAIGGIDTTKYKAKDISNKQPETITIMMYGRLSEKRKGTMIAVKACEMIYKKNKNIKLLLFDSPVDEKSQRLIDEFDTTIPFDFVLNHPFDKNTELFHRADIFVAVEKRAGWANTVAESMACGIPVVATQSGTKDLLIPNSNGILVKRNRWSVKKGIETLIYDSAKRKEFGKKGRLKVEEFDWHKLAEVIVEHLSE